MPSMRSLASVPNASMVPSFETLLTMTVPLAVVPSIRPEFPIVWLGGRSSVRGAFVSSVSAAVALLPSMMPWLTSVR